MSDKTNSLLHWGLGFLISIWLLTLAIFLQLASLNHKFDKLLQDKDKTHALGEK